MSQVPAVVGERYRLGEALGRGGMGTVYRAVDERLQRPVAVKLLRDELAHDPSCAERFRREAQAAARATHPGLVAIHDLSLESRPAYIVMELLSGTTIADMLAQGPIDWRKSVGYAIEVLDAVHALHTAKIVHRDIKPANVVLTDVGGVITAKLIDLGIAQIMTGETYRRLTASGQVMGTPSYMSPEQLSGGVVGPASDLWGVGVLLYCCITGQRPFDGESPAEIIHSVRETTPTPLRTFDPKVPEGVQALLDRLLAKDPTKRPSSAKSAANALRKLRAPKGAPQRGIGTWIGIAAVASLIAGLVGALGATVGALVWRSQRGAPQASPAPLPTRVDGPAMAPMGSAPVTAASPTASASASPSVPAPPDGLLNQGGGGAEALPVGVLPPPDEARHATGGHVAARSQVDGRTGTDPTGRPRQSGRSTTVSPATAPPSESESNANSNVHRRPIPPGRDGLVDPWTR